MLLNLVAIYLVVSILIGLVAARRVHSAADYITAGRNLPMPVVMAMVFATWFGAETVLGISATFLEEGFRGLISDPLGASICLILFGLVFALPLYRLKLLTLGDFFRVRYDRRIELVVSLCIVISYLGWVAAQITALGLVLTLDLQVIGQRHKDLKNGLTAPPSPTIANIINLMTKPRWCLGMAGTRRHTFGNLVGHVKAVSNMKFATAYSRGLRQRTCIAPGSGDQASASCGHTRHSSSRR